MAEYVAKEQVIEWFRPYGHTGEGIPYFGLVSDIHEMKAADVVTRAVYDQTAWERDLAVQQLKSDYGVGLGERKADVPPVVRCKDCKWFAENNDGDWLGCQMFHTISACPEDAPGPDDFCSFAERMDGAT